MGSANLCDGDLWSARRSTFVHEHSVRQDGSSCAVIVIYVVGGMSGQRRGLMMTLIRITAGSGFGVQLPHVGGSVLDCLIRKVVGDLILLVLFRKNSEGLNGIGFVQYG